MTTEMHKADGVHRLVDMVVEEVSLVDRAANKHRFLIVKRDEAMDDDKTQNTTPAEPSPPAAPTAKLDDNSALNAALAALESLTGLVELLGELGADQADARLAGLAEELRSVAMQLLERTDGDGVNETDEVVEARVKSEPATFAANVTAAKQALARLGELAKQVPTRTDKPAEPKPEPVSTSEQPPDDTATHQPEAAA